VTIIQFLNWVFSATIIAFCAWLAGKKPVLSGFIVALPLTTLIVLPLTQLEWKSTQDSVAFAKSIFLGIPVSLLFFIPFFFSDRLKNFWWMYGLGLLFLVAGFFAHQWVMKKWL